jgi:hypothetical protein
MKQFNILRTLILPLLLTSMLSACGSMHSGRPMMQSAAELQKDEIAVVGLIELVPPLTAEEQDLQTATSDRFAGKAVVVLAEKRLDLNDLPISAGNDSVMADLGKVFFARMSKHGEYVYSGSFILTRSSATTSGYMGKDVTIHRGQLNLPGGLMYDVKPGDRAIYIGSFRYHRNKNNAIVKIEHIDDYKRVNAEFVAKFGRGFKLTDVKPKKVE